MFLNEIAVPEDNQKIWRYMSYSHLSDFILTKELYFSRSDRLGDPLEGSLSKMDLLIRNIKQVMTNREHLIDKFPELIRNWVYVNCWHMSDHASNAMWKLYGDRSGDKTVAIQTAYGKLFEVMKKIEITEEENKQVKVGQVTYSKTGIPVSTNTSDIFSKTDPYTYDHFLGYFFNKHAIITGLQSPISG